MSPTASGEVASAAEAAGLIARLSDTVERLHLVVTRETELLRAARLADAALLEPEKRALSGEYQCFLEVVRRNAVALSRLAPEPVARLRDRHGGLQDALAVNLAVVGTARAVAEDIMRGLAERVAASERPSGYGAGGAAAGRPAAPPPIRVSRAL